jgi:hypothetical protein
LRKITKELVQRYVREIVKEAVKQAVRNRQVEDIQRLQEKAKGLSDLEKERLFQGASDDIPEKFYNARTKDNDLVKEISNIIQNKLLNPEIITAKANIPKKISIWKRIFFGVAKLYLLFFIAILVIGAYLFLSDQEHPPLTELDRDWSPGTGDVQATLSWYADADIDLHVIDPLGEEIYYLSPYSSSGGKLDLDNKCDSFEKDKPENIFWPEGSAPSGTYRVRVNYYEDCKKYGQPTGPVDWTVTTKVHGKMNTFRGTLYKEGDTQDVSSFQF